MDLSVIVPMFNEEKRLDNLFPALVDYCSRNVRSYEILVVDDGSRDNTVQKVLGYAKGGDVRVLSHKRNLGKGAAVRTGLREAKGDKVVFIDADGSIAPGEIGGMLALLDDYDIVYGTRRSKDSVIAVSQPVHRTILAKVFNKMVDVMFGFGVDDLLCGFKGFRKDAAGLFAKELKSNRFEFDVELFQIAKSKGYSTKALPIAWRDSKGSKLNSFVDPFRITASLVRLMRSR